MVKIRLRQNKYCLPLFLLNHPFREIHCGSIYSPFASKTHRGAEFWDPHLAHVFSAAAVKWQGAGKLPAERSSAFLLPHSTRAVWPLRANEKFTRRKYTPDVKYSRVSVVRIFRRRRFLFAIDFQSAGSAALVSVEIPGSQRTQHIMVEQTEKNCAGGAIQNAFRLLSLSFVCCAWYSSDRTPFTISTGAFELQCTKHSERRIHAHRSSSRRGIF